MLKLRPLIRNWAQLISVFFAANLWIHPYNLQHIHGQMNIEGVDTKQLLFASLTYKHGFWL